MMIRPDVFAQSNLQILQADPAKYVNYGVYWYFVKALLKKYFTRENLYLLGDYIDHDIADRMPKHANLQEAISAAIETFNDNMVHNMGSNRVLDPVGGGKVTLLDPDAGL